MKIRVNGKDLEFEGESVKDLLDFYKIKPGKVVVEKNSTIVHRENYGSEILFEGDVIEIVNFVGGG